jgi:hypothetical protein
MIRYSMLTMVLWFASSTAILAEDEPPRPQPLGVDTHQLAENILLHLDIVEERHPEVNRHKLVESILFQTLTQAQKKRAREVKAAHLIHFVQPEQPKPDAAIENDETRRLAPKYGGTPQVKMLDGTWCDLLTRTHAIEVEWAAKHYEAVGQAIHYGNQTGRRPGVILLVKDPAKEWRFIMRCAYSCGSRDIGFWVEEVRP